MTVAKAVLSAITLIASFGLAHADEVTDSGEINIVVANRFLVTVKGENVSQKDLTDYAMGINYKKLAALP